MMWLVKGMVYKYYTNENMKRVPLKLRLDINGSYILYYYAKKGSPSIISTGNPSNLFGKLVTCFLSSTKISIDGRPLKSNLNL